MLSTAASQIENTVQKKNVLYDSKTEPLDYKETYGTPQLPCVDNLHNIMIL